MKSIEHWNASTGAGLRGLLTDIDGTLTDQHGRLLAGAYEGLWRLREAGLRVIPVTGRPAGWCDLIVRQWPVDAVIGENGALAYALENGKIIRYHHPAARPASDDGPLGEVRREVLERVLGSRVASDQQFRLFDLAIDFAEDPPDLGLEAAEEIYNIFISHGCHAKISNIHVNGWLGEYDKLSMVQLWLKKAYGESVDDLLDGYTFCGDSPNDEPMFEFFPKSCAVANIREFIDTLEHHPTFITPSKGGLGFCELVDRILAHRT